MKTKRTPKRIGELAELAFLHRATKEGLIVSHPYGDSAPFDFITLGNGKLCRVQVKCAGRLVRHGQYHFNLRKNIGKDFERYSRQHIDFIAGYILPLDTWYILPPPFFLRASSLDISPQPNHRSIATHKAKPYFEAWHLLFDREAAGFTLHACSDHERAVHH
jgi:hypothetical protein